MYAAPYSVVVEPTGSDPSCLGSCPHSIAFQLCDLGPHTCLCVSGFSSVHGDNSGVCLVGLLGGLHETEHLKQGLVYVQQVPRTRTTGQLGSVPAEIEM